MKTTYNDLLVSYRMAISVCDPIDFPYRQKALMYAIAQYLLEKDKPIIEEEDEHRLQRSDSDQEPAA